MHTIPIIVLVFGFLCQLDSILMNKALAEGGLMHHHVASYQERHYLIIDA